MTGQPRVVIEGFLEEKTEFKRGFLPTASGRQNNAAGPWDPVSLGFLICVMGTRTLRGRWGKLQIR